MPFDGYFEGDNGNDNCGPRYYILNSDGNPVQVDFMTWAKWFGTSKERFIKRNIINGILVSSIFLGLDHAMPWDNVPILWEHAVRGLYAEDDWVIWRFKTREDMLKKHEYSIKIVNKAVLKKRRKFHYKTKSNYAWR